ncbi:camphor resistance protein CrcB [Nakamurella panacisegetis]|uniref:Fluoride-specific ion channel FluC n=1 Tax=Nakamurella panacisegetis TaxID=1090615 RepID=A0A1H0QUC7_9ACTN|nr:fluoride efflux transporter CrcB [Nakamurella panacisegetis]SDP20745.1 camphor resistance protein CrcB [Nakamurella panacisegetis]
MVEYLVVAAGAAVGAPLRYLTDRTVQARHDSLFPWGTFTVNVVGSLILGVLTGATLAGGGSTLRLLIGTGFCGALTTYSTLSFETVRLIEQRARFFAVANMLGTVVAGLGAAVVGFTLGQVW